MKYRIIVLLLVLPALIGVTAYWFGRQYSSHAATETSADPRLETADKVDLGRCRTGDHVTHLILKNIGQKDLVVDRLSTSCGCISLVGSDAGSPPSIFEGATVKPGEEAVVQVRVGIRAGPQKAFNASIYFRTNEPGNPLRTISIVAEREDPIRSDPGELVLGSLLPGQKIIRTILLSAADETSSPKIDRVECSRTDLFEVTRRDPTPAERETTANPGLVIAALDISGVAPKALDALDAKISIFEQGDAVASHIVPIVGVVRSPYMVSPSTIVLPNMTSSGPAYHLNCLCRGAEGQPFRLEVADGAGLSVTLATAEEKNNHSIRVEWPREELPRVGETATRTVRLIARSGDSTEKIALEVLCRPPEAP